MSPKETTSNTIRYSKGKRCESCGHADADTSTDVCCVCGKRTQECVVVIRIPPGYRGLAHAPCSYHSAYWGTPEKEQP